ncbi:MAG TPA: DUF4350 domain-containing protein, partial [Candidatus Baltobacteraceae bacterium]|nr:DUF4350 domain-containing protein [Candidatus Baltobacteraceae bacterium]
QRFEGVLGTLDDRVRTLIVSGYENDPSAKPMDRQDAAALRRFVENGGRLVVLDDDFAGRRDITPGVGTSFAVRERTAVVRAASPYTAGVQRVAGPIRAAFPLHREKTTTLLANRRGAIAITYRLGRGEVVAVTAPALFGNANLRKADNLAFAYDAIAGHGTAAFDEYVHGYDQDLSFWGALPPSVHAAFWIVCAIVVLALIGANVPFAPAIAAQPPDERDSSGYLTAMATLMQRGRARHAALTAFAHDAKRRVRAGATGHAREALAQIERACDADKPTDELLLRAAVLDYRLRKDH